MNQIIVDIIQCWFVAFNNEMPSQAEHDGDMVVFYLLFFKC
jgi:hypothetical protein